MQKQCSSLLFFVLQCANRGLEMKMLEITFKCLTEQAQSMVQAQSDVVTLPDVTRLDKSCW